MANNRTLQASTLSAITRIRLSWTEASRVDAHDYHDNEFKALETYVGTKSYTAPETWSGVYHKQSDIWSVGVCLWCMLTGQYPFDVDTLDKNDKDTLQFIEKLFIFPQKIHLEKMNDLNFDENLKDLLHRVFTFDAKSRIDITNFT